jgi:outer membrane receptor for ferrienterochelin and colicins
MTKKFCAAQRFLNAVRVGLWVFFSASSWAQQPAAAPPVPPAQDASGPAVTTLQRVEINAARATDTQQRRDSTAAKIIVGRDEIERFGDSTVGDLLKRLPGVTVQGRPGRGGAIRMRGLGNGYTQILLDGERVAPGFSIDSLAPEQIERIEILRAPTAETGARAIAGTINIITREGYTKRLNNVQFTLGAENGRVQPQASWSRNDTVAGLNYNFSLSANRNDRQNDSSSTTVGRDLNTDAVVLDQRDKSEVRERRQGIQANGRLQWRGAQGESVTVMPLLIYGQGKTQRYGELTQTLGSTPAPYDLTETASEGSFRLLRLNGMWTRRLSEGARMEWRAGAGQSKSIGESLRLENSLGTLVRTLQDSTTAVENSFSLNGKFIQVLESEHSLTAGGELESNRRTDARITLQTTPKDSQPVPLLLDFGDAVQASATRFAFYAQDDWVISPQWSAYAGLRWEGISTQGGDVKNRSSVWTPLAHAVWKPAPDSKDQVRFSLTRSYRSPTLQSLIARPSINNRFPTPCTDTSTPIDPKRCPNTETHFDRAGNPNLKPELATGLDVAIERYLPGSGLISANVFHRQISNYMRSKVALETVSWATVPRYVSRMQNIGAAVTQGVELEAKFRLTEWMTDGPKVDIRSNLSFFRSRVQTVPGPDNRLDQQPSYTANFGADYRVPSTPLSVGGNVNWTPGYTTRISDVQTAEQGKKVGLDAYALWVFSPTVQLRTTFSNIDPRDYITGSSLDASGVRESSINTAPTFINLQMRLEIKL